MFKKFCLTLVFLFLTAIDTYAAGPITPGEVLNLQQCVEIALQNHPYIHAARETVRVYESRIGQARAGYLPQLTFESGYQRIGAASYPVWMLTRIIVTPIP